MTTDINSLNDDLLVLTFQYLNNKTLYNVALVSPQWNLLTYDSVLLRHRYQEDNLPQKARRIIFQRLLAQVNQNCPKNLSSIFFYTEKTWNAILKHLQPSVEELKQFNQGINSLLTNVLLPKSQFGEDLLNKTETLLSNAVNEKPWIENLFTLANNAIDELKALKPNFPFVSLFLQYKLLFVLNKNDIQRKAITEIYVPLLNFIKTAAPDETICQSAFESNASRLPSLFNDQNINSLKKVFSKKFFTLTDIFEQLNNITKLNVTAQKNLDMIECLGYTLELMQHEALCVKKEILLNSTDTETNTDAQPPNELDLNVINLNFSELSYRFFDNLKMFDCTYSNTGLSIAKIVEGWINITQKSTDSDLSLEDIPKIEGRSLAIVKSFTGKSTLNRVEKENTTTIENETVEPVKMKPRLN